MRRSRLIHAGLLPVAFVAIAALSGCQTIDVVSSDGRPMPPKPRPAPKVPDSAVPHRMILLVGPPRDSNGNGYPDTIPVQVAVIPREFSTGIDADGAFVFTLYRQGEASDPNARPLREWRFEGPMLEDLKGRGFYGTGYLLLLGLLDEGTDRWPPTRADLRGRFEPVGGTPTVFTSDELRPVLLGARR